jgi:hypothetical protein
MPSPVERTRTETQSASAAGRAEAGFALPLVLFLVALLTALLAAGLMRVEGDIEVAEAGAATISARAVAWSALQTYTGTLSLDACGYPIRPPNGDSVRINVPGGYGEVVARVVRRPADSLANWLYLISSTGYAIEPAYGPTPVGTHTAAQFALWQSGRLSMQAAFTAANGLTRTFGGNGQLHGADEDSTVSCRRPDKAALRVPWGGDPDLTDYDLTGTGVWESGSGSGIVTAANIDWARTLTAGVLAPDFTSVQTNDWNYSLQLVSGNAVLGAAGANTFGTGLLIVSGNLTILGNTLQWYGVILVGGQIRFDAADQRFDGLVASGLNAQLGSPASVGSIGGDYLDIDYNSAYVRRAMRPLMGFAPVANATFDNWWTY